MFAAAITQYDDNLPPPPHVHASQNGQKPIVVQSQMNRSTSGPSRLTSTTRGGMVHNNNVLITRLTKKATLPDERPPLTMASMREGPHQQLPTRRGNESLKRTLSGVTGFSESISDPLRAPSPPLNDIQKLHQAVFFDENDFDDDLDFDFAEEDFLGTSSTSSATLNHSNNSTTTLKDVPSFPTNRSLSNGSNSSLSKPFKPPGPINKTQNAVSTTSFTKPKPRPVPIPISSLPQQEVIDLCAPDNDLVSSAPIPWSSSPVEHRMPQTISVQHETPISVRKRASPISAAMDPPAKKSRTLPWKIREEEEAKLEEERRQREERNQHMAFLKEEKIKIQSQGPKISLQTPKRSFPWDKSLSVVKAAQKTLKDQKKPGSNSLQEETDKKKKRQPAKIFLSNEQKRVIDMVVTGGKSVFFTGSAGTGKSVLLREIISALRKKHSRDPDRVAVTASTGLAACNVGGITLHSYAGIGLGREPLDVLVKKIKRNNKAKTRWLRTKVLIIDEVSMVDGDLFDKLEGVARNLKNNGRPFGGIQLVVTGDFFQLPPVPDGGKLARFAFEAATWNSSVDHTIGLTHIFRQKDPVFANMLNEMRVGKLSPTSIDAFRKLSRPITYTDGLEATELFPTRNEVDNANTSKLRQLKGDSQIYRARDESKMLDEAQRNKLLSNCMAPNVLELKVNAQVMLIKNLDETLVNGSLGRVVGFMSEKTYALATSDGEYDSDGDAQDEDHILKKAELRNKSDTAMLLPYVQFSMPDGTARRTLIHAETWKTELPTGEVQASRLQVPLILAWAISIHKAQGQTLERVKVDLGKVFEKGQAYVALSRATSQAGLQVMRFDAKRVMAHDKVRAFYQSLYSVTDAGTKQSLPRQAEEYEDEEEALREVNV